MKRDDTQLFPELAEQAADGTYANAAATPGRPAGFDVRLAQRLLQALGDPPIRLTLWNGESVFTANGKAVAGLHIANRPALLSLFVNPELNFGEGYTDGTLTVEGDLAELIETANRAMRAAPAGWPRRIIKRLHRAHANNAGTARDNISPPL